MGRLENAEFVKLQQALSARYAFDRGFDGLVRFGSSDRIVAFRIWVLGLITASTEPVQGSQSRNSGELSLHDINNGNMPARSGGSQPLLRQQRRCALTRGVIGKGVGGFWIIADRSAGAFDVATGRREKSAGNIWIGYNALQMPLPDQMADLLFPFVPSSHHDLRLRLFAGTVQRDFH